MYHKNKKQAAKPKWKRGQTIFSTTPDESGLHKANEFIDHNVLLKNKEVELVSNQMEIFVRTLKDIPYPMHQIYGA